MREASIQTAIRLALGARPAVLVARRNVGLFVAVAGDVHAAATVLRRAGWSASPIAIGAPGEADLQGIVGGQRCQCGAAIHSLPFALEVKTATGRQSVEQKRWATEAWQRRGGLYAVVRSPAEALAALGLPGRSQEAP